MSQTNTIRLHRVLRAAPEKVYRAFLDADAKAKWLPPHGFTGKVHHLDARVGGSYKFKHRGRTHRSWQDQRGSGRCAWCRPAYCRVQSPAATRSGS